MKNDKYLATYPNLIGRKQLEDFNRIISNLNHIPKFELNNFVSPLMFGKGKNTTSVKRRRTMNLLANMLCACTPYHHAKLVETVENYRNNIEKLATLFEKIINDENYDTSLPCFKGRPLKILRKISLQRKSSFVKNMSLKSALFRCIYDEEGRALYRMLKSFKAENLI